ncbi:hypothetical protein P4B35_12710 [Pontiellaceae bacterium B12227]|nr:hypothetical protein [Pontiellaceae bacterium B12227]
MKKEQASRIPILLSAFGCPGMGQFFQKRWIPGVIFAAGFLVGFVGVMKLAVQNIRELYSMAFSPDFSYEPTPVPLAAFIAPLTIAAVFWLISLFDVFFAHLRKGRSINEEIFLKNNLPATGYPTAEDTEQHGEENSQPSDVSDETSG